MDYIRQHGYPVEAHEITTADGYILTYHRIPHGKLPFDVRTQRKPVLLQHGLLASSAGWVITPDALAYSLADAGFDLWLGNARGNTYSRKNIKYDPDVDKHEFWDFSWHMMGYYDLPASIDYILNVTKQQQLFYIGHSMGTTMFFVLGASWHEMGYYDLPASIDYILNVTKQQQLFYIGHSMGTTMFFVLGATRPEYMAKVKAAELMAPVAYSYNVLSPLANFINYIQPFIDRILKLFNIYEFLPFSKGFYWLDHIVCSNILLKFICRDFIFEITGFDPPELNETALPTDLNYLPAGTSLKTLQHFSQICKKDADFHQFDYGNVVNMMKYHSPLPPRYNLTNMNTSLYIHYANNDWLAVPKDVMYTVQRLPNVKQVRKVPFHLFNHLDFMWAIDAKSLVYDNIIQTLQSLDLKSEF